LQAVACLLQIALEKHQLFSCIWLHSYKTLTENTLSLTVLVAGTANNCFAIVASLKGLFYR